MFCMNCGLELPEEAKFCRKCAMPLIQCPECGEDLPKRAKFCWRCGKEQLTEGGFSESSDASGDSESVLPQRTDNASIFARMSSAKAAEDAAQNSAPSPFKSSGSAKRESGASSYSPAGMPSAFKPTSEKKKQEKEEPQHPAPVLYDRFADAASPFKPLGSAKTETASSRPSAPRATAASAGSRPAAPRGAASVAGSRPAAPRGAAAVAGSRPAASLRPEAQEVNEEPSAPASPFKPAGSSRAGTASRPAAPRGAAAVAGSRPAAPRGAAAVAGSRPAAPRGAAAVGSRPAASAPRAAMRPAAQAAAKEEPVKETPTAPAVSSSPFKPFAPAKTESAPAKPSARSAFTPAAAVEEPVIENETPAEPPRPSPPVTFVPSGLFKPLDEPKAPETSAPQTPSPFASGMSSSPFASGSAFSPLSSSEPDLEVPKKSFGFAAYRPGISTTEETSEEKKPVNPTAMFNMNSNTGAMSSLGGDEYGSLSSLGSPDAGSLGSDDFEDSDEKLPQRDGDHPRFFRRTAPTPAPEVAPEPSHVPDMKFNLPKVELMKPKTFSSSNPSPFRSVLNAGSDDEKPAEREPGASPFKPL